MLRCNLEYFLLCTLASAISLRKPTTYLWTALYIAVDSACIRLVSILLRRRRFYTSVIITRLHLRNKRWNILWWTFVARARCFSTLPTNPLIRKSCASRWANSNHLSMPAAFSWRDTCAPSLIEIENNSTRGHQ